ncbi:hypothetical protein PR202_gb04576 [Eleusine coracana subsp. coracana]|uniref:Peptidase A1 domain-containing protein n=1 Tax=Eleusine coracana subsp. coracana TaxID=191504 RepID=A0AAV5E2F8_ELECO|nr:hypothetical protein PR202_gb04576 [Eleusine coracana subsp. coracana]
MKPAEVAVAIAVTVAALLAGDASSAAAAPAPAALRLERALPHKGVRMEHLMERDRARHARRGLLGGSPAVAGVVDFPVEGSANPYMVGWVSCFAFVLSDGSGWIVLCCSLYFTRVKLGNPAKEFFVQIDTGSDILWIELESFNPDASSTSSRITCSDDRCTAALQTGEAVCQSSDSSSSPCGYTFTYGDGSGTSGYYVSDTMYFDTVMGNEQTANSSTSIVFGCSNSQSGDLTKADRAVDGIFGFGQHQLSVISQLNSLGVSPKVFSHCLKGSDNGGGILVLGEIVEPGLVYTPLVPSQPHYNLNLESIAVSGQKLPIDNSLFATSNTQGTIVDSGTTLAYLADGAYDPFVSAVSFVASEVFGVSRGGKQEAKDTWWWNDKVQRAIKEKKECFKRLHLDKSATNIEGYKIAKRAAKRAVSVAKGQAYDNLYQRLGTKEGEKDIYRMARIRERKTRDINQIKCIKDGVDRLLTLCEKNSGDREIEEALKRMKSGKAMGPDGIPIEITAAVSPSVRSIVSKGNQCFITSSSVDFSFPTVTLYFMGNIAMTVKPENYLLQQASVDNNVLWCIGWQRNQGQEITILGDLVLKDKIFVYDLANMRMGWADYDCSMSVNVTTSSGKNQYVNTGQFDVNGSLRRSSDWGLTPTGIAVILVHMLIFGALASRR